jgi:hypothetical protein
MDDPKELGAENRDNTNQSSNIIPSAEIKNPPITTISIPSTIPPFAREGFFKRHWGKLTLTMGGLVTLAALLTIPNSLMDFPLKWRELFKKDSSLGAPRISLSQADKQEIKDVISKSIEGFKESSKGEITDERHPGFSWHCLLRLNKPMAERDNFIFDYGRDIQSDRFSVYLDWKTNLCARIIDHNGNPVVIRVRPGLDTFQFGNILYLSWEFGITPQRCFSQMAINGRIVAELFQTETITVQTNGVWTNVVGADLNKSNGGAFEMIRLFAYDQTIKNEDSISVLGYLSKKAATATRAVAFFGTNWLARSGTLGTHGNFQNPDEAFSPRIKVY